MLNPSFHAILNGHYIGVPGFGALRSIGAVWNDPAVGQKKPNYSDRSCSVKETELPLLAFDVVLCLDPALLTKNSLGTFSRKLRLH